MRHAARLAGDTEAAFRRLGLVRQYTEQATRTRLEAVLSDRLAITDTAVLLAEGAALSPADAISIVLRSPPDP